ncbi:MAG: ABC transporter ATP-binding protein [Nitrospirae bacterium]|nr:ABC transporter ATP-binding protein [Nitrospirota bacterium]
MTDTAIRIEGLGKQYRIGTREPYKALRDVLTQAVTAPFKRLRNPKSNEFIWALKDVSFEIKRGEVVGIIGRNGAGKSTLLKILSRVTEPTEGYAEVHGRIGSLLEVGTGFHPELSGRENIYLNGAILGMKRAEIVRKFDEIVAFAEVEEFIDTPVKRYSSGMYLRLAFSVAAHLQPEILLVDEVLAVGDIEFQKKCIGKMGDISKEGRTILFVSHNLGAIRSLCENAIWIDNGQIAKKGAADEVARDYEEHQLKPFVESAYTGERNHEDIKNQTFYISRVEMLNEEREHTNIFRYNGRLTLIADLAGNPASGDYSVEFRIYKANEGFVCMGASGAYYDIYFDKKVKRIRIEIGPLILTNGEYTISLSVMTGTIRADTWESACSFHILECQPFAPGREVSNAVCILQHSFSENGFGRQ